MPRRLLSGSESRPRHELAIDQHASLDEKLLELCALAHDGKADRTSRAERGGKQQQRQHARHEPQIEILSPCQANDRKRERPDADQRHETALLGDAIIGDAPIDREEQQDDRQSREPNPIAPEQSDQRAANLADRVADKERRGADHEIEDDHQLPRVPLGNVHSSTIFRA